MHDTLIHINLHKENESYYILCTITQNTVLHYMENLHETINPTIYSIAGTHYYIADLSN